MSHDIEMKDASPATSPAKETPKTPVRELSQLTLESTGLKSKVDVRPEPVLEEGIAGVSPQRFAELAHWYVLPGLKKASPFLYSREQIARRQMQALRMHFARKRQLLGNRPRHSTLLDLAFAGQGNLHDKKRLQKALQKQVDMIWKS